MYEIICVVEDTAAEMFYLAASRCLDDLDEFVYLSARMCEMFSCSKFNSRMGILN